MEWMIVAGALVTLGGLAGLIASAVKALRARRAGLDDDALRARLQRIMALNMAALFLSVIGLMLVIAGLSLG